MAETQYKRLTCFDDGGRSCKQCGVDISQRDPRTLSCSRACKSAAFNAKLKLARHEVAKVLREFHCAQCQISFLHLRKKKFCSQKCRENSAYLKLGNRPLSKYREDVRNPEHYFDCEWCKRPSWRCLGGKNIKHRLKNRWCSGACMKAQITAQSTERVAAHRKSTAERKVQRAAHIELRRREIKAAIAAKRAAANAMKCCEGCASPMPPEAHGVAKYCSPACRPKPAKTEAFRASKKRHRKMRKMAARGVHVEAFDDIEIFDRDGWRCQICGVSTPQKLRGTYKPNAPELDHIIPVSKGGPHTRANTQCACRSCNGEKSDKVVIGQRGLFV